MRALPCYLTLCIGLCIGAQAQTFQPSPQTNANEPGSPGFSSATSLTEYREILKEERQLLEVQAEKHYARIDKLIDRTTYGLGLIAIGALAILGWGFGKTRNELRSLVREQFEKLTSSLIQSEVDHLTEAVQLLKKEVEELR